MASVIDFSANFPLAEDIKRAGHIGVVAYVSPARDSWMLAKPISREIAEHYKAAGLKIAAVWQYSGASNPDSMRGAAGGREDARSVERHLKAIGLDDHPVFFAVDFDISLAQWNNTAVHYFRAAVEVLGRQRVGIYGHSRVVAWAQEDGVVADLGNGRCLGWVTSSWSGGANGRDYAVLYQRLHNTAGPSGVMVDVNDVFHDQWGWSPIRKPEGPVNVPSNLPRVDETRWLNKHFSPGRVFRGSNKRVEFIIRHHIAGIGGVNECWNWWQTREASAHYCVDPNGRVGQLVRDTDTAWSAGDSLANAVSISIEHSNSGGAAQDWPINEFTIVNGARLAAELCLKHNLGRPQFGKNIRDHSEFYPTACPYHLRNGGRYHSLWMKTAQQHYDSIINDEDDMTPDQARKLDAIYNQMSGSFVNGEYPGFDLDALYEVAASKGFKNLTMMEGVAVTVKESLLTGDQLSGPGRDPEGGRTFAGWELKSILETARERNYKGLTLIQMVVIGQFGTDKDKAAIAKEIGA